MTTNARPIDVAASAVTLLNSAPAQATFGSFAPFTAVRDYLPLYDLTQHKGGLLVTVIPAALTLSPFARLTINSQVAIDVGVQNFVQTLAQKDAMMLLVEQISAVLEKGLTLPEVDVDCGWEGTDVDPLYIPDHMLRHSIFTSVPRIHYLTRRAR